MDLSRKRTRNNLAPRREPYWQQLSKGNYLGFRRGPDTWIARHRDRSGRQSYLALPHTAEFNTAKKLAEAWFDQVRGTGSRTAIRGTVREALETYLQWLTDQGRSGAAASAKARFESIVWPDPIAPMPLYSLTRDDVRDWRDRLKGNWAARCSRCGVERRLSDETEARCTKCRAEIDLAKRYWKARQPRSINRHVRSLVAGLNRAHAEGHVGNPDACKLTPLADDADDGSATAVMLTPTQRKALIDAVSREIGAFLRALEFTGARPGELAAATVGDLDLAHETLTLSHRKGRPAKLRARSVVLSPEAAAFFQRQARRKLPTARLFTADGQALERHVWAKEIRAGILRHNAKARGARRIPANASAYSFRHARISELLQVHGIDPLTVAEQTGTSVKMIEKAYFRFIPSAMRDKLRAAS